jgi:hypothetical protein
VSVDESIDPQSMALKKLSPLLVERAALADSLAALGMQVKFSYVRRYRAGGVTLHSGLASIYSKLAPREALIAFANWYYQANWIKGMFSIHLYPLGQRRHRFLLEAHCEPRVWHGDTDTNRLKPGGRRNSIFNDFYQLNGVKPPADLEQRSGYVDWEVVQVGLQTYMAQITGEL